jgi:hypothetical protein
VGTEQLEWRLLQKQLPVCEISSSSGDALPGLSGRGSTLHCRDLKSPGGRGGGGGRGSILGGDPLRKEGGMWE